MKIGLQFIVASVLLVVPAFGQEPSRVLTPKGNQACGQTIARGSMQLVPPVEQPKALPLLDLPLGDVARLERAAHSNAPKAKTIMVTDTAEQPVDDLTSSTF